MDLANQQKTPSATSETMNPNPAKAPGASKATKPSTPSSTKAQFTSKNVVSPSSKPSEVLPDSKSEAVPSAGYSALEAQVQQLRREAALVRLPVSEAARDLIAFTQSTQDPLLTEDKESNPFAEPHKCDLL